MNRLGVRGGQFVPIAFAGVLAAAPAYARPPASERTRAALMKVEHQWLTALQRHDAPALARILAREFIDSTSRGNAVTRTQYLAYFAHLSAPSAPLVRQDFQDIRVRFFAGGNVSIVTGVVITSPGAPKPGQSRQYAAGPHTRFTDVFVWSRGRWQAVSGQETRLAAKN